MALLATLIPTPFCRAKILRGGSMFAFATTQWTNVRFQPISYCGKADRITNEETPVGLLWPQGCGDVALSGDGSFAPDADVLATYGGPPGVSGMILSCWGVRNLPLIPGARAKDVTVRFVLCNPTNEPDLGARTGPHGASDAGHTPPRNGRRRRALLHRGWLSQRNPPGGR